MGSSESTGPLVEELEMNTQGPNHDIDDYQRLMTKSDIFQDISRVIWYLKMLCHLMGFRHLFWKV